MTATMQWETGLHEAGTPDRLVVPRVPLLARHAGTPPDLVLRWANVDAGTSTVDVVVHFHGFSGEGRRMRLQRDKERISGLDLVGPSGAPGRNRPTLTVLPRGHHARTTDFKRRADAYTFPALVTPAGVPALVELALGHLRAATGMPSLSRGRLLLTGHSGGGAAVEQALAHVDPDEVHIFDGTYGSSPNLVRWAKSRLACERSGCGRPPGALRILYLLRTQTEAVARRIATEIAPLVRDRPDLARRYRVDGLRVPGVSHTTMPTRYGWRLLADPAADLTPTGADAANREDGAGFRPVPMECPGGGRVRDKRPPATADVVQVPGHGRARVPLQRHTAAALIAMIAAARADGLAPPLLMPVSGFRSPVRQARLWRNALAKYGSTDEARKWVAPPGSSAHQSGRAVDLHLGFGLASGNVAALRATRAFAWLQANAIRFGFFPYTAEPWHWEFNPPNPGCTPGR